MNWPITPVTMNKPTNIDIVVKVPEVSGAANSRTVAIAAACLSMVESAFIRRFIPSTTTMAESTKIPTPKMSEKRERKLILLSEKYSPIKPNKNERGIANPANKPSRQPIATTSNKITKATVCKPEEDSRTRSSNTSSPESSIVSTANPSSTSPGCCNASSRSVTALEMRVTSPSVCLNTSNVMAFCDGAPATLWREMLPAGAKPSITVATSPT